MVRDGPLLTYLRPVGAGIIYQTTLWRAEDMAGMTKAIRAGNYIVRWWVESYDYFWVFEKGGRFYPFGRNDGPHGPYATLGEAITAYERWRNEEGRRRALEESHRKALSKRREVRLDAARRLERTLEFYDLRAGRVVTVNGEPWTYDGQQFRPEPREEAA